MRSEAKKQVVSARFQVKGARGSSKAEVSSVKAELRTDEVTTGEGCAKWEVKALAPPADGSEKLVARASRPLWRERPAPAPRRS